MLGKAVQCQVERSRNLRADLDYLWL